MGFESPSHWLIIAVVVLVLFGYKKLPEMSRSVGRSLRIFKTEMKGMGEDDNARDSAETPAVDVPAAQPVPVNPLVKPSELPEGTVPQASVPPIPAAAQPIAPVPPAPEAAQDAAQQHVQS